MTLQEREHPRYAHEAAITLNTPDTAISGRTSNVSRGGLCATLCEPLAVGVRVEVDVQLVFEDDRHSEPLRLAGFVVWCTAVDDGHQVGVRFQPTDVDKAEDLTMFLRYLDNGAGAKPERPPSPPVPVDERFG